MKVIGATWVNQVLQVSSAQFCDTPSVAESVLPTQSAVSSVPVYVTPFAPPIPFPSDANHTVVWVCALPLSSSRPSVASWVVAHVGVKARVLTLSHLIALRALPRCDGSVILSCFFSSSTTHYPPAELQLQAMGMGSPHKPLPPTQEPFPPRLSVLVAGRTVCKCHRPQEAILVLSLDEVPLAAQHSLCDTWLPCLCPCQTAPCFKAGLV